MFKNLYNNNKKAVILICIAVVFLVSMFIIKAFAEDERKMKLERDPLTNEQYLYFDIEHTFSDATYKYYGYGYTVSIYDRDTKQFLWLKNENKK